MSTKNYLMASRKPNMHRFGMFPASNDLSWIDSATMGAPDTYEHSTTLTGTMNGSNADFVMVGFDTTVTIRLIKVIWNGLTLQENTGFTVSGGTITMAAGYIPDSGDTLSAMVWT